MNQKKERRRSERIPFDTPEVALAFAEKTVGQAGTHAQGSEQFFVDLFDKSNSGAQLRSTSLVFSKNLTGMMVFNRNDKTWEFFQAAVRWVSQDQDQHSYIFAGVEFKNQNPSKPFEPVDLSSSTKPTVTDYEFFRTIDLLKRIHRDAVCPLLNILFLVRLEAGGRLITQGDEGDCCYIIQEGDCQINVEKEEDIHTIAQRGCGDIIGEMALLTGEPRSAHVDAKTRMRLWAFGKNDFKLLTDQFPEIRSFLTELVAERFAAAGTTAERRIGKYLITDVIGRGGYAIVYKGVHTSLNMPVAIKMLNHDMAMDPEFLENFHREAQTIASFNHENIIKVYDIEKRFKTMFIVMELIKGRPLRHLLNDMSKLSPGRVLHYLLQICAGLQYAHERSIVHQDVKPGNIFVLENEKVKILDFGLACQCGAENMFTGTPYYMSPEQVECLPVDERTDIYALGLTAYELLAGHRPFDEKDPLLAAELHVEEDIPDPAEVMPDLPAGLSQFILKACARDPQQRYRNIPEVMRDLQPLASDLGIGKLEPNGESRKMATLFMIYEEDQQLALKRLMDDFSSKVQELGVVLKAADFSDV